MQPPLKLPFCSGYRQPRQIERSPIRRSLNHWPNISSTIRFPSHILFTSTLLLATSEHLCSSSRPNHPVIPSFFTHFGAPAHVSQPTAPAAIPNISNALVPTLLLHSLSRAHRERERVFCLAHVHGCNQQLPTFRVLLGSTVDLPLIKQS